MNADPEVRVVIGTGAGDNAFCAGADLKDPITDHSTSDVGLFLQQQAKIGTFLSAVERLNKPSICACNGAAIGSGLQLALCFDLMIMADTAYLWSPLINLGIYPAARGTIPLIRTIGPARTMELVYRRRRISSQEAYEWGVATLVVPGERLMDTAMEWALDIAQLPAISLRLAKESILQGMDLPYDRAVEADRYRQSSLFNSEARRKGHAAFLERQRKEQ